MAYNIIGGGEEGDKTLVRTKEEADHSLPYMVAVAILDGQVMPEQYRARAHRARRRPELLRRVIGAARRRTSADGFPTRCRAASRSRCATAGRLTKEKRDYEGFYTRPMRWETVVEKFDRLSAPYARSRASRRRSRTAVATWTTVQVADLTRLLTR